METKKVGRPKDKSPKNRLQVPATDQTIEDLETVQANLGAPGREEAVRRGLALARKLTDAVKLGSRLQVVRPDGSIHELELL